jgi:hypothetical protein
MNEREAHVVSAGSVIVRAVHIGGQTKAELLEQLSRSGVAINELGKALFASDRFTTSEVRTWVATIELSAQHLGLPDGGTTAALYEQATRLGLRLCPLEVASHLRLQLLDQPEGSLGQPASQHRAPAGSITIASPLLSDADDFPKGFYLRRIESTPWLRGYACGPEHVWDPEDRFVFATDE